MTNEHHLHTQSNTTVSPQFIAARAAMERASGHKASGQGRNGRGPEWPRMTEREIHDLIRDTLG